MSVALKINIKLQRPGFTFECHETFKPGITGIFGHSGAGKTTLLQCISGLIKPDTGEITCGDRVLYSSDSKKFVKTHKRKIGYVFQEGRLFPHYNVKENLLFGQRFLRGRKSIITFESVVEMLNIGYLLHKYPGGISGGERQRVALGRALMSSPDVLLLDEPFSALDQRLRLQIIPFINRVVQSLDIPVLLVSHDLPDIVKLTNRLCLLKNGSIIGHDQYEKLLTNGALYKVLPSTEVINTVILEVKKIDKDHRMITLNGCGKESYVNIVFEPNENRYDYGDKVKVFLRPNDIIVANEEIGHTSFQNQIEGVVENFSYDGPRVFVNVDCGFPLVAEISRASADRLGIKIGKKVFCLFKSLALDSIQL